MNTVKMIMDTTSSFYVEVGVTFKVSGNHGPLRFFSSLRILILRPTFSRVLNMSNDKLEASSSQVSEIWK